MFAVGMDVDKNCVHNHIYFIIYILYRMYLYLITIAISALLNLVKIAVFIIFEYTFEKAIYLY